MIYGKACHLPVELVHRASWALQTVNLDLSTAGDNRFHQIHELEELRDHAYAYSYNYKLRTKELHDRKLRVKEVFPYGTVEIEDKNESFKVNGHCLKHYIGEKVSMEEGEVLRLTASSG
ncbi:uncharacterized protein LOC143633706 [Bidens hawaiensis]|uniref:uncharacterized protein LOC143633706 n=1 Tax=Bidens hawaiensis TaxID=980011 RepID=UPI00404A2629